MFLLYSLLASSLVSSQTIPQAGKYTIGPYITEDCLPFAVLDPTLNFINGAITSINFFASDIANDTSLKAQAEMSLLLNEKIASMVLMLAAAESEDTKSQIATSLAKVDLPLNGTWTANEYSASGTITAALPDDMELSASLIALAEGAVPYLFEECVLKYSLRASFTANDEFEGDYDFTFSEACRTSLSTLPMVKTAECVDKANVLVWGKLGDVQPVYPTSGPTTSPSPAPTAIEGAANSLRVGWFLPIILSFFYFRM